MEWRHPSVIAFMGPPYTGKTSIALNFVDFIKYCMYISLEKILDTISDPAYSASSPPTPQKAEQLINQAFDVLCRVVETQLSLGLTVIIDAQLSSRSQLYRLVHLSTSLKATKFVIVDCKINQEYAWQTRFEKDRREGVTNKLSEDVKRPPYLLVLELNPKGWYRPQNWEDVTMLIHRHNKIRLDEPIQGVSRLLVNVDHYVRERHITQAVQALIFCQDDRHLDYQKWFIQYIGGGYRSGRSPPGHYLGVYREEGLNYEANCGVCEKPILGAAYACNCSLMALHKSCAEMESGKISFTPQKFPTFIRYNSDPPAYSFPENHACLKCREAGQEFSDECRHCIFESHLKCRLIPTVIKHDGHNHILAFWSVQIKDHSRYNCLACGMEGAHCCYKCQICSKAYHVECALLPYPVKHRHGGYEHDLKLMFSRDEKLEDYLCDECGERMNPEAWYYDCGECSISYHLLCAFKDDAVII